MKDKKQNKKNQHRKQKQTHKCLIPKENRSFAPVQGKNFVYLFCLFTAKPEEKITVNIQEMQPNKQR